MTVIKDSGIEWIRKALNPYDGVCPHSCRWELNGREAPCYVENYRRFGQPVLNGPIRPVDNFVHKLQRDLERMQPQPVLLSNRIDPYAPIEEKLCFTRLAIAKLIEAGWTPVILTKSTLVKRDLELIDCLGWVGMTLTSPEWARKYENASSFEERVELLKLASKDPQYGIPTWISWEPIPPNMSVFTVASVIEEVSPDFVVFGSLNWCKKPVADYSCLAKTLYEMTESFPEVAFYFKDEIISQLSADMQAEIRARNRVPWYESKKVEVLA